LEFAPHESVASFIHNTRFQRVGLPEHAAKLIADQILQALVYMHSLGYVHGDIKPHNFFLFNDTIGDPIVKLGDLGCTRKNDGAPIHDSFPGTAHYRSPEILRRDPRGWDAKADMWSFGIALHFMLTMKFPPKIDGKHQIMRREPLSNALWADMPDAKDVVERLLQMEPDDRPTAEEIRSHPWFMELDEGCRGLAGVGQPGIDEQGEEFVMGGDSV
jgi:serine/threonine protein kinase